ncbi:hypothetical protein [Clostridium sp. CF012]|uniref:hypothetical protein n=1 Tax=Clostridium sp. CF012 TaxID=2843319 RepID=UPI001C0BA459|nr:hypothetical protein [Clostridium sp. CF012]MBU3146255.1 hypothetical protein [Clostridium sp. CF012]
MDMYKNLDKKFQVNITGNREADRIIVEEFNKNYVVNKVQLKKILWKKFKETFKKK